jgi:uncharacterized protein (TIGR02271 family)
MPLTTLSLIPDLPLPSGAHDARGWAVHGADGERVGRVVDLLLDEEALRWLEVDVGGFFRPRSILLPADAVRVDRDARVVHAPTLGRPALDALPDYPGDPDDVTPELEASIRRVLSGAPTSTSMPLAAADATRVAPAPTASAIPFGDHTTRVTRSEEDVEIGKRLVQVGEVVIRKTVETERVVIPVPRVRDEVEVERIPATDPRAAEGKPYQASDEEMHIPIVEEEVVITTRQVVREVLVVRKRRVRETVEASADVRRERVQVEETGNVMREQLDEEADGGAR